MIILHSDSILFYWFVKIGNNTLSLFLSFRVLYRTVGLSVPRPPTALIQLMSSRLPWFLALNRWNDMNSLKWLVLSDLSPELLMFLSNGKQLAVVRDDCIEIRYKNRVSQDSFYMWMLNLTSHVLLCTCRSILDGFEIVRGSCKGWLDDGNRDHAWRSTLNHDFVYVLLKWIGTSFRNGGEPSGMTKELCLLIPAGRYHSW